MTYEKMGARPDNPVEPKSEKDKQETRAAEPSPKDVKPVEPEIAAPNPTSKKETAGINEPKGELGKEIPSAEEAEDQTAKVKPKPEKIFDVTALEKFFDKVKPKPEEIFDVTVLEKFFDTAALEKSSAAIGLKPFESNIKVRRSNGIIEDGWSIVGYDENDNKFVVAKRGQKDSLMKKISDTEILALNPLPTKDEGREKTTTGPRTKREKIQSKTEIGPGKAISSELILENFETTFGIKKEELETIEDFDKLSIGQQILVFKNLEQITLGRVQEEGAQKEQKATTEAKFLGQVWHNFFRGYYTAKAEKATARDIIGGGLKSHGDYLKVLVASLAENGPEVKIGAKGELEIQYLNTPLPENQTTKMAAFNKAAAELARVPYEWSLTKAPKSKHTQAEKAQKSYERIKAEMLTILETTSGRGYAVQRILDVDKNVRLSQFLTINPEAEKELKKIQDDKIWRKTVQSVVTERGLYMGAGYVTRAVTMSFLGAVGVPLAAAGIGGWMARGRAIEALKREETHGRLGGKSSLRRKIEKIGGGKQDIELLNFVGVENLTKKIDGLIKELNQAKNKEDAEEILADLDSRLYYTHLKLDGGLVNFGSEKERLANQYALLQKISEAEVRLNGFDNNIKKEILNRLDGFLGYKEKEIKKFSKKYVKDQVIRGAIISAGFATLGYAVRDFFWGSTKDVRLTPSEGVKMQSGVHINAGGASVLENAVHAGPNTYIEIAHHGSSVWSLTEDQLQKHFESFKTLSGVQKNYLIDALKDKIIAHPERYGLAGIKNIDELPPGAKINFSELFKDGSFMERVFSRASVLSRAQVEHVLHDNEVLRNWVHAHPHEQLSSEKVQAILNGQGDKNLTHPSGPKEPLTPHSKDLPVNHIKQPLAPGAKNLPPDSPIRTPIRGALNENAITSSHHEKFLIPNSEELNNAHVRFVYENGRPVSANIEGRLLNFRPETSLKENWLETAQNYAGRQIQNPSLLRSTLFGRIRNIELTERVLTKMPPNTLETRFVTNLIKLGRANVLKEFGNVLRETK